MRTIPACLAFGLFFLLTTGWRVLYLREGSPIPALGCLALLAALSVVGGYRVAIARRRAMLEASIETASGLRRVMTGRIGSAVRAIIGAAAAIPVVAYLSLTASDAEMLLGAAAAAWAVAMALVLQGALMRHLRPDYRLGMVAPAAIWLAAAPVVAVAAWFAYAVLPIPDFARAADLSTALSAAMEGLPRHNAILFEMLSALRAADATVYWVLARDGFQSAFPLSLFLLKGAVSYVSITKVAVDCQAALHLRAAP